MAAAEHALEVLERGRGVAAIDGIGEIPRRHAPGVTEERLDLLGADRRARAERARQHAQQPGEPAHVLAQVAGDEVGRVGVESHRCVLQPRRQPCLAVSALSGRAGVDDVADLLHRVHEALAHLATTADEHERGRRHRVGEVRNERLDVVRAEPAHIASHHDPPFAEERWRLGRVDDRADLVVVAAQLLDRETGVSVAEQPADQVGHRLADEYRVVAPHEVGSERGFGCHTASSTAAIVSHTRRVPFTSWARMIRQPRPTPIAVTAIDASRRWSTSSSRRRPRNVLFDADSNTG